MCYRRNKYLDFCKKLNKVIFEELICSGDNTKVELLYDENDVMFQEIYIPMFEDIIFGLINNTSQKQVENLLHTLCENSYCVGDKKRITKLVDRLMCFQPELLLLYQEAKEEEKNNKSEEERRQKELSDELDEYLRIGEEIEKERQGK